ncbi:MAG: hypothetical protein HYV63_19195 [Candidatus Schekmanbacteria bacterium]|nr:hypothetical protein [Candidatus Schekmanbacteria bacterium]
MGDDQVVLDFCDALNAPSAPDCTNSTYCYQNVSATDLVEYHVDEGYTQGYFVYSTSNWSDYTMGIEYDTDRPGGDSTWSYQDDPDPDTCATACTSDTSCWAYTFTPPGHFGAGSKARCYHKSRIPDAVDMPSSGLVSGVRQAPVFMGYRRTGTVILSTVYKTYYANEFSWQASSNGLENCRDACSGDAACIAYDFDTKGGTCELFSHLDPLGWIPDDDWAYGMLSNRLSVTAPTNGQTLEYGIPVTLSVSAEYTAIPSGCGVYWKSDVDGNMGGALSLFGSTSWTKSYTFLSPGTRYITSYISCDGGASSYINPESDIAHPHYNPSNRTLNITAHNSQPNTPVITSPAHNSQVAQTFVATNSATDPNETLSCSQRSTKLCRKLLQLLGGYTTSCSSAVTGCSPTLTTANLGWHWLEVTATDDYGLSTKNTVALLPAPTDVYITTGSAPVVSISQPAADATLNVGTSYTLTGSVSGRSIISTYKWYYTLGPEASYSQVYIGAGSSLSWTPTSSIFTGTGNGGFYLFLRFYATDSLGKTGVQVRRVWISDPNNVPS